MEPTEGAPSEGIVRRGERQLAEPGRSPQGSIAAGGERRLAEAGWSPQGSIAAERSIVLDGWKLNLSFSSAHCLPYMGKCERLHGHHYAVSAEIFGNLGEEGIVMDFVEAKRILKNLCDELDHRVLVPTVRGKVVTEVGEREVVMTVVDKRYVFPRADCALLELPTTTAENLAAYVLDRFVKTAKLPRTVTTVRLGVDEGYGQGAWAMWIAPGRARDEGPAGLLGKR